MDQSSFQGSLCVRNLSLSKECLQGEAVKLSCQKAKYLLTSLTTFLTWNFLALLYAVSVCLSHLSPTARIVCLLFLSCLCWPGTYGEVRRGDIVVCIIVAALMLVVSLPMHSTLLSLTPCIFGSETSDMMMQEENTRLEHFSRSAKYDVEMICFMFNIAYINKQQITEFSFFNCFSWWLGKGFEFLSVVKGSPSCC